MKKIKIFWSYATSDATEASHIQTSWLGELQSAIEKKLGIDNTRCPFEILRDKDGMILGGDNIAQTVTSGLNDCDFALLFISEAYVMSDECAKEVRQLVELAKPVIVVEMLKDWPDHSASVLSERARDLRKDLLSVVFWHMDSGAPRLLADPAPSCVSRDKQMPFHDKVHHLDAAIRKRAAEVAAEREAKEDAPTAPEAGTRMTSMKPGERFDLFLATPTKDAAVLTDRLKTAVERRGFSVLHIDLTDENITRNWDASSLEGLVGTCRSYAQVVGPSPGIDFQPTGKKSVHAQFDAALKAEVRPNVLLHPDFDPREIDGEHRKFLENCGYQDITLEDFEACLVKTMTAAQEEDAIRDEIGRATAESGSSLQVAIDFDPADRERYVQLSDLLLEQEIAVVPAIIDKPKTKELKKVVKRSDGVVVVFGQTSGSQKRASANFQSFLRFSRNGHKEICKLALGVIDEEIALPRAPNVPEIHLNSADDDDGFEQFVTNLKARRAPANTGT